MEGEKEEEGEGAAEEDREKIVMISVPANIDSFPEHLWV